MSRKTTTNRLAVALAAALCLPAASAMNITREFSSSWYDPSRSGHGFIIEVIDNPAGKSLMAYWFTYDAQGRQIWMFGNGPVVGDRAQVTAYQASGGSFDNQFNPAAVQVAPWGTLEFRFDSCDAGSVRFAPNDRSLASGSIPLQRLTRLYNSAGACSGGINDDRALAAPAAAQVRFMTNTGVAPAASGKVSFEQRADRTEFKVEAEDLPLGDYLLRVNRSVRGTLAVTQRANGSGGELEFRSPVESGKLLLDFDPRSGPIELVRNGSTFLTAQFDPAGTGGGSGGGSTGGGVTSGLGVYELVVEPAGNDGPELHAELERRPDRVDFQVELEDVGVGSYDIRVDGVVQGALTVASVPGGTEGEIEFRAPVEDGKQNLDFDPRGKLIEAVRNGTVVLAGILPAAPTGSASGDATGGSGSGSGSGGGSGGGNDGPPGDDSGSGSGGGGGTGGGGDDPPALIVLSLALGRTGADSDANGNAVYEISSNEREFELEFEDVDDGTYAISIGGSVRASVATDRGRGRVKFRSPSRADSLPLDFDPRGMAIEVTRGGIVYLRGSFPGA